MEDNIDKYNKKIDATQTKKKTTVKDWAKKKGYNASNNQEADDKVIDLGSEDTIEDEEEECSQQEDEDYERPKKRVKHACQECMMLNSENANLVEELEHVWGLVAELRKGLKELKNKN